MTRFRTLLGYVARHARRWPPRLGLYGRVMVFHYVWHIQVIFLALVGAVTAINISPEVAGIWSRGEADGFWSSLTRLSEYVFYRLLDNGSQVFPVAFVLGIVWAEVAHVLSGRQTMVRTAGMPFQRGATALFLVAALSVPAQFLIDNAVRPYAFMSLSLKGLGEYGWAYGQEHSKQTRWLPFDGDIIQLEVGDDPEPRMSHVTFYEFSRDGDLRRLVDAESAQAHPDGALTLTNARAWDFSRSPAAAADETEVIDMAARFTEHATLDMDLAIAPLWLEYRGIAAKYIPLADLARLARATGVPDNAPHYAVWLKIRFAQAFAPGLIAVCLSGIFFIFLDRFGLRIAAAIMLAAGYLGFTAIRVMAVVADHGVLPDIIAIWALPALLAIAAILLIRFIRRRDRYYEPGG